MSSAKKTKPKNASKPNPTRKASTSKRTVAAPSKPRKIRAAMAKSPDQQVTPTPTSNVSIAEQDVVLLQTTNHVGMLGLEDAVFQAFSRNERSRPAGTQWVAFGGSDMPHHIGRSNWIGLSRSVPLPVLDAIQAAIEAEGLQVERDVGRALHLKMNPFARLSDDGLEILVPAALVGDPTKKRIVPRGGTKPTARGYHVKPDRAASLQQLFFGRDDTSA